MQTHDRWEIALKLLAITWAALLFLPSLGRVWSIRSAGREATSYKKRIINATA